ncbi:hypothetical protein [Anaerospora sp.]|uniref:hypothetical protein n=1 Tax=Anaerospora sp. TaxID=1960278 RepID=UPI00289FBABE|nr:hypothetical protein [Anaerospora sp.]
MKLTPVIQVLNQNKARRMVLKRDDIEAALKDTEVRPCVTRQATPEECLLYGINPGAKRQDKPIQQFRKRWA